MAHTTSVATQQQTAPRRNPFRTAMSNMWSLVLLVVLGLTGYSAASSAQTLNSASVTRAQRFMATGQRGQEVFNYLHFGTDFRGYEYVKTYSYDNGSFALQYSFDWDDTDRDHTEVWFIFSAAGGFDHLEVARSTAFLNQPFLVANVSIGLIGNLIIDKYKDNLSDSDRRFLQQMVHDADAKGMLNFQLKLDQALGT